MARLFAALRPPAPMRERLSGCMHGLSGARWQTDEQLHLTLRFFGEVDRHRSADIAAALARIRAPELTLGIDGVGFFASKGRPHSLLAAVAAAPELTRLAKSVDRAAVEIGLAAEARAFRPHITLARLGRATMPIEPWLAEQAGLSVAPVSFGHLLLYESILGHGGSTYVVVERFPLG